MFLLGRWLSLAAVGHNLSTEGEVIEHQGLCFV